MNRRAFLGSLIGGIVAASAVRTWPFRVFSFPSEIVIARNSLNLAAIQAIEVEHFAKEIPDLIFRESSLYRRIKERNLYLPLDIQTSTISPFQ